MFTTSGFSVAGLEPFPVIGEGDCLVDAITGVSRAQDQPLRDGDIVVVASKVVSIAEKRHVALADVTPSAQARELSQATGKPASLVQLILDFTERLVSGFVARWRGLSVPAVRLY